MFVSTTHMINALDVNLGKLNTDPDFVLGLWWEGPCLF